MARPEGTDGEFKPAGQVRKMPFGLGTSEILIILAIVLLLFGAKRLPEMGRSLGKGLREFKQSISGENEPDQKRDESKDN
jgi:sec-independent protein translocase protein TatA